MQVFYILNVFLTFNNFLSLEAIIGCDLVKLVNLSKSPSWLPFLKASNALRTLAILSFSLSELINLIGCNITVKSG